MKLIQLITRHQVLIMDSGIQVIFDKEMPIACSTPAGQWYYRDDLDIADSIALVRRYVARNNALEPVAVNQAMMEFRVNRI